MRSFRSRALDRRRVLALGLVGAGALGLAHMTSAAATIGSRIAPGLRPEGTGGSAAVCAICGREGHSMLHGACLPRRMRR
jgi:hypothetical protein